MLTRFATRHCTQRPGTRAVMISIARGVVLRKSVRGHAALAEMTLALCAYGGQLTTRQGDKFQYLYTYIYIFEPMTTLRAATRRVSTPGQHARLREPGAM